MHSNTKRLSNAVKNILDCLQKHEIREVRYIQCCKDVAFDMIMNYIILLVLNLEICHSWHVINKDRIKIRTFYCGVRGGH